MPGPFQAAHNASEADGRTRAGQGLMGTTAPPRDRPSSAPAGPRDPAWSQAIRFHRHPLGVLRRCRESFGSVFELRLAVAGPTVVVAEPEAVEALLAADPGWARAGEARRAVLPMASPHSVLGGDGEVHHSARARLAPLFAPEAIAAHRPEMIEIARRHVSGWPRGRPIQLLSRIRTLVDDVFVRLLLGVEDDRRAEALVDALGTMLRTPGNPPLSPPGEGKGQLGRLGQRIFETRKQPLERLLVEELEDRRSRGVHGDDVLGRLLGAELSTERILEEVVTLTMAAQEPPSIALTWTLERLGRHPALAADYLAAAQDGPLRAAVFRETLRLRPSALAVLRRLSEPFEAGGHLLPAGTSTMVPLPLMHRDPGFFPDPERFRPQRWLEMDAVPPVYLPFGGGGRRCLGEALAEAEAATIVPTVLSEVRIAPLWPREERMVLRGTVLVPHRSVPARIE
jgi:cytochrome P450 family 135